MGACLSCLGLGHDGADENERVSLLGHNDVSSDVDMQEALLKQQQRQNELSVIVNDLSENLIDVSTFLSKSTSDEQETRPNQSSIMQSSEFLPNSSAPQSVNEDSGQPSAASPSFHPAGSEDRSYPCVWPVDRKIQLMKDVSMSHASFEVMAPSESLYVVF